MKNLFLKEHGQKIRQETKIIFIPFLFVFNFKKKISNNDM